MLFNCPVLVRTYSWARVPLGASTTPTPVPLLEDERITGTDTRVKVQPKSGTGGGVVEAPRGTLAHEYVLTKTGQLKSMKLIIPTQLNKAAININVKDAAMGFIQHGEIKPGLLNRIEMVIRAY